MKARLAITWATAALLLSGCATTVGTPAKVSHSGFDNAKVVTISHHGGACTSMVCTGLGAQWSAKSRETAIIVVSVSNQYAAITGAKLSIDGEVVALAPAQATTSFDSPVAGMRESTRAFSTPLETVRSITRAKRVWLRVSTADGTLEDAIIDGERDSKAFHAMKRFLAAVDS